MCVCEYDVTSFHIRVKQPNETCTSERVSERKRKRGWESSFQTVTLGVKSNLNLCDDRVN